MNQPLPGVYTAKKKDGTVYFRASLTYRNKHISLGSHEDRQKAHEIYCIASALLNDASLRLEDYHEDSPLAFSKWVCLINFRDNGLYFSSPIYIRPRLFLTKTTCFITPPAEFPDAADTTLSPTTACRSTS